MHTFLSTFEWIKGICSKDRQKAKKRNGSVKLTLLASHLKYFFKNAFYNIFGILTITLYAISEVSNVPNSF